jgi:thiol-disulfide isomerase/thioredoxin
MMNKLKGLVFAVLVCLVTIATPVAMGRGTFPSLKLKNLHGKKVRLGDLRGKIVVLNFWATWCGPCKAEMPLLMKSAASYASKNIQFVGVSVDEAGNKGKVARYVEGLGIAYPIWVGATDDDMKRLELGNAVPSTAFLDADGRVRARILGQMQPGEIEERLNWLIDGGQAPGPALVTRHLDEQQAKQEQGIRR